MTRGRAAYPAFSRLARSRSVATTRRTVRSMSSRTSPAGRPASATVAPGKADPNEAYFLSLGSSRPAFTFSKRTK